MTLQTYGSFVAFAVVLILVPGPDFAVVTRNALAGRWRGAWAGVGVTCSNAVQGIVAALGLGALITESHTVFSLLLAAALDRARRLLSRRRVRRALDAGTGTVLIGFGARLAVEQA